jgi:hypothetical protein
MTAGRNYIQRRDAGDVVPSPTADALFYVVTDPDGTEADGVIELSELATALAGQLPITTTNGVALTGVIWNGTPPSSPIVEKYNISRVGKRVTIDYLLAYSSAGTANTSLTLPWLAGWPLAYKDAAADAAGEVWGNGLFAIGASGTGLAIATSIAGTSWLRRNSGNTADEVHMLFTSGSRFFVSGQFSYTTT